MSWWGRLFGALDPPPAAASQTRAPADTGTTVLRGMGGGRVSVDTTETFLGGMRTVLPPNDADSRWRQLSLDSQTLDRMTPAKLLELLADLSPDVSRALYDYLRLVNPGSECTATLPGKDEPDTRATAAARAFLDRLRDLYGSTDVVWARLFIGAFMRGAFVGELVLDEAGRMPVDFATPDPYSIRFLRQPDPVRGSVWVPFQWQGGTQVMLDRPTFRYVPIDPFPGSPYGRGLASPALFSTLFLLGLMHDLRRVIAQQGYPRIDIAIVMEKLLAAMPADQVNDPEAQQAWINAAIEDVKGIYAGLEPDDAYVHPDVITVNRPVGTVDSSSLGAVGGIIEALERMNVRALKTVPFMMALSQSATETMANRQWEAHLQDVKSFQHAAEQLIEYLVGLGLQAQGIQAAVTFRYAENRASEMLRDEQTRALKIANTTNEYLMGWINQDEAAEKVVGHAPDQAEPRAIPAGNAPTAAEADAATTQPEPGVNRSGASRQASAWAPLAVVREAAEVTA